MRRAAVVLVSLAVAVGCATTSRSSSPTTPSGATTTGAVPATAPPARAPLARADPQYRGTSHWLCHPDLATDACRPGPEAVVAPDGTVTTRPAPSAPTPPKIDCFYVYPTVNLTGGLNSSLTPGDAERVAARAQVARYASVCRLFAPAYRQVTLAGSDKGDAPQALAYGDVLKAWHTYLAEQNHGRGVVLIGHSQGGDHVLRLVHDEIDARPDQRRLLVSAVIMGSAVAVPVGKDVGGSFQHVPACRRAEQTGCVISFASYPAAAPPAASGYFGADPAPGQRALCVDPAALAGGNGLADPVMPRQAPIVGPIVGLPAGPQPFVALPGALRSQCVRVNGHTVLAYRPAAPGTDRRSLQGLFVQTLGPDWGLHLFDANLAQDNLISIVTREAAAWSPAG